MAQIRRRQKPGFFASIVAVFSFFFVLGGKSKRTKLFFFLSLLPVLIAVVVKLNQFLSSVGGRGGMFVFSNIILSFYLQFLILILALFFGTSVCSEELESKTLTYLTSRPIPKSAIILGKYAAYTLLVIIIVVFGVVLSFFILNLSQLNNGSYYIILLKDLGVLILGIMCYTALFTFIGTIFRKSVLFGLGLGLGWENVIQYFPGSTQKFAVVHYLKSLLPSPSTGGFSFLLFRLEPSSTFTSIFTLFLLTAIFLFLACIFFSKKEYIMKD